MKGSKIMIPLFALILFLSAPLWPTPVLAAEPGAATLAVDTVWLEDGVLCIQVTEQSAGKSRIQTLKLNLRDYAGDSDEYVSVRAVDRAGNESNTIQFKNPYYKPTETAPEPSESVESQGSPAVSAPASPEPSKPPALSIPPTPGDTPGGSASAVPDNAFSPDGNGTVLDDATDADGKEFFTIEAEDGAVFFLVVDRQRTADNVYFLNTVTEEDLLSLAKPGANVSESGVPTPDPPAATEAPEATSDPTPAPPQQTAGGVDGGTLMAIVLAAAAAGGVGYYVKILRPKRQSAMDGDEEYDEPENTGAEEAYDDDGEEANSE
jgi:hypothetical protein